MYCRAQSAQDLHCLVWRDLTYLVCVLQLRQLEFLRVHDGFDVIRLDSSIHLLKLLSASHENTTHGANVRETVKESRRLIYFALFRTEERQQGVR